MQIANELSNKTKRKFPLAVEKRALMLIKQDSALQCSVIKYIERNSTNYLPVIGAVEAAVEEY